MTSWTLGHTDRFVAGVVGAPCTNLYSMYGTSDIGTSFGEVQWGGTVVDACQELLFRSPITYAANVTAPVLLLHGESDYRCPISQSEEYYTLLKRLGQGGGVRPFPRLGPLLHPAWAPEDARGVPRPHAGLVPEAPV